MNSAEISLPLALDVSLRGHRTYLHSTNLFDFLVCHTGATHNLSLTFRRKIEHEAEAVTISVGSDAEYAALFRAETNGSRVALGLLEKRPLRPLRRREPYDEDAVVAGSEIRGNTIIGHRRNGASPVERIVALNKRLISQTTAPQKVLIFSKIFLSVLPADRAVLGIALKSRLGLTLFRSTVSANGHDVGEIVFYGT